MTSLAHPPIALIPRLATFPAAAQGDVGRANLCALITSQINPDGKAVARPGGGPGLAVNPALRPSAAY